MECLINIEDWIYRRPKYRIAALGILFLCAVILLSPSLNSNPGKLKTDWVHTLETGCPDGEANHSMNSINVCCSPTCHEASVGILSQIKRSEDPCENFYEYACGNTLFTLKMEWSTKTDALIPYTQENQYRILLKKLRNFLQDETDDSLPMVNKIAKLFYKSCQKWYESIDSNVKVTTLIQEILEPDKLSDYFVQTLKENPSCEEFVVAAFPEVMHAFLYRNRNGEKSKEYLKELMQEFRTQLRDSITKSWMQQPINSSAVQMLDALKVNIGFPPELAEHLKQLDGELLQLNVNITHELNGKFADLVKNHHENLTMSLNFAKVNGLMLNESASAFLSVHYSVLVLPESKYLDGFHFHRDYPDTVNLGRLGTVLGHEFLHAINLTRMQNSSLDPNVKAEYTKRTQCYVDQYSKFMIGSKYVNGTFTLDENISDNEGLKIAYKVYKNRNQKLTLPRIHKLYTQDQLFFISYAQTRCDVIQSYVDEMYLDIDNHSPLLYRIQGSLTNMPEFAAAFNCPVKSKYNSGQKRCGIF